MKKMTQIKNTAKIFRAGKKYPLGKMTYIKSMTPIFWVSVGVYDRKMTAKNDHKLTLK